MARKPKPPPKPPLCSQCGRAAVLVGGLVIYPHRPDLADKNFWRCACGAYVGCHGKTTEPLGTPAALELRVARSKLHDLMVDPIWRNAIATSGYKPENDRARVIILNTARARTYAFLASELGIDVKVCHIGMFDLATCRRAWTALRGVSYSEIRAWAKARKVIAVERQAIADAEAAARGDDCQGV